MPRRKPEINGHRVEEKPVLPTVWVVDQFLRTADALSSGLRSTETRVLEDVEVLSGVVVDNYEDHGQQLGIEANQVPGGLALSLKGERGAFSWACERWDVHASICGVEDGATLAFFCQGSL